jgi:hypothetical protein
LRRAIEPHRLEPSPRGLAGRFSGAAGNISGACNRDLSGNVLQYIGKPANHLVAVLHHENGVLRAVSVGVGQVGKAARPTRRRAFVRL